MENKIQYYLEVVAKLRRAPTAYGKAPHKLILLLTLTELIELGEVEKNEFPIMGELLALYLENWNLLVDTANLSNIHLPLFHLQRDGIWELMNTTRSTAFSSFSQLKRQINHGKFDADFFSFLKSRDNRNLFVRELIEAYFPSTGKKYFEKLQKRNIYDLMETWIANDRPATYDNEAIEYEDTFVRRAAFKK